MQTSQTSKFAKQGSVCNSDANTAWSASIGKRCHTSNCDWSLVFQWRTAQPVQSSGWEWRDDLQSVLFYCQGNISAQQSDRWYFSFARSATGRLAVKVRSTRPNHTIFCDDTRPHDRCLDSMLALRYLHEVRLGSCPFMSKSLRSYSALVVLNRHEVSIEKGPGTIQQLSSQQSRAARALHSMTRMTIDSLIAHPEFLEIYSDAVPIWTVQTAFLASIVEVEQSVLWEIDDAPRREAMLTTLHKVLLMFKTRWRLAGMGFSFLNSYACANT